MDWLCPYTWTHTHTHAHTPTHTHTIPHSSDRNVFTNPTHTCRIFVHLTSTEFRHYQIFPRPFLKACVTFWLHKLRLHTHTHTHSAHTHGRMWECPPQKDPGPTLLLHNAFSKCRQHQRMGVFLRRNAPFSHQWPSTSHRWRLYWKLLIRISSDLRWKICPQQEKARFSHLLGGNRLNRFSQAGGGLQRGALTGSEEGGGTWWHSVMLLQPFSSGMCWSTLVTRHSQRALAALHQRYSPP